MPARLFLASVTADLAARRAFEYALAYLVAPTRPDDEIDPDHEYLEPPLVQHVADLADADVAFLLLSPDWLASPEGQTLTRRAVDLQARGEIELLGLCARAWEEPALALLDVRITPTDSHGRPAPVGGDPPDSAAWLALARRLEPMLLRHFRLRQIAEARAAPAPPQLARLPAAPPDPLVLGRFRAGARLHRELAGDVLEATDSHGRRVWIKHARIDRDTPEALQHARLAREVAVLASLDTPHVQRVHDFGQDHRLGRVVVMEPLDGETLLDRLRREGPLPHSTMAPLVAQVWRALADLHRAGVAHGRVLPSVIQIATHPGGGERVVLLDFGACFRTAHPEDLEIPSGAPGAFGFLPPESFGKRRTTDTRVDLYACAVTAFQALSGHSPYSARNVLALLELQSKTDARRLGEVMPPPVPPALEAFFAHALDRDPDRRFQTAEEALEAWSRCELV